MNYEVDVAYEYQQSKSKFLRLSLLFSAIFSLVIIADTLMITLSKENYIPFLVISIIITILFIWFAIFFFTNVYNDANSRYRYFKGYESGQKNESEVIFISSSDKMKFINGMYVYPIHVKYLSNLNNEDKIIYSFKKDFSYKNGDKLIITTYQKILLKAALHK